jgi:hypothetical protein
MAIARMASKSLVAYGDDWHANLQFTCRDSIAFRFKYKIAIPAASLPLPRHSHFNNSQSPPSFGRPFHLLIDWVCQLRCVLLCAETSPMLEIVCKLDCCFHIILGLVAPSFRTYLQTSQGWINLARILIS